jgi:alpha-2-macroglobulin
MSDAWGDSRLPLAGALFTERGIYRPGERVYAKAIVRDGPLGALRAPAVGDSVKWRFHDREGGILREATARLSSFGTSSQTFDIPAIAATGEYGVEVLSKRLGKWRPVAAAGYRIAEYRPPEFLVDVSGDSASHHPGETFIATVQSRYLFGAPMGRAALTWMATQRSVAPWELSLPGLDGWFVGTTGTWDDDERDGDQSFANGADTLDARGIRALRITLPQPTRGRAARVTVHTTVTDINRQVVGATTTTLVHPADFYIAAKPIGDDFFWKAGTAQATAIVAARPNGEKVVNVPVTGTLVRREWHRVRRQRDGISEIIGEWVSDTVGTCAVTTAATPATCTVTPRGGGEYVLSFTATDRAGRAAVTSFDRWAAGPDWVPWSDESQFKMDVIPDRKRYSVGDTATVLFASPFTNAEAWITVEREGLLEQRRLRIGSGATSLKFPITEAFAPNAYVSIIVTRGRSAPPGPSDDPGRPTIRVGYADLRVTPEVKRLAVTLVAAKTIYRPGDSAHVSIRVRDAQERGSKSEVTLWAVEEGVLALTGYKTPDPIDLIYRERGVGMRLASNMTVVAPQVPEGEKGQREPGGGGGAAGADVLRSRFQSTAFFLGSVITDAAGNGTATAKLPDNLTTFRLMAVAVTAGDRYGKGESSLLVTRPLLARPALPRFVRPGDEFTAGAVVNRRDGAPATVHVRATATGASLRGDSARTVTLAASRGAEVRFPFHANRTDSATFRFDVTGERPGEADAVRLSLPVRPEFHPRAHTLAGVLRDTATVELLLPTGIDPVRSRLSLSLGTSPLSMVEAMGRSLRIYPYDCSEQVISSAVPLIALYRAQRQTETEVLRGNPVAEITRAIDVLSRRQRADGAIGYWSPNDWSTAWLSAYAGAVMLDARDVGVKVDSGVLSRLAGYLRTDLHDTSRTSAAPVAQWYDHRELRLRDQVAAVDFLSRFGRPDIAEENELLRTAPMLALEDRARLAQVMARRGQLVPARQLMAATWSVVRVEGNRAVIPDSARTGFYFDSYIRPIARILVATLAVEPTNVLVGPLVETLVQQERAGRRDWEWNTQDYASAVTALAAVERQQHAGGNRTIQVRSGNRVIFTAGAGAARRASPTQDSTIALTRLLSNAPPGRALRVSLAAGGGTGVVYYYLTVVEIPTSPPVTPEDAGIQVERSYERYPSGTPVTTVTEGELVRVRLRVTVHSTRQFLVLDDALPAGLEAIDLSLRTASTMAGPGAARAEEPDHEEADPRESGAAWAYGVWDGGWWSPFDHREIRDDRVVYAATLLWPGTYSATYIARATTPGTFLRPPAHAEEMYNPGANGRSDGGTFVVLPKQP